MDRREFVLGAAAGLATLGTANWAQAAAQKHAAHDHHAMGAAPALVALRQATADCETTAADCARHCIELLGEGDPSLAECLVQVQRMRATVEAMGKIAGTERVASARTAELAAVCADFCRDCAAACKPHAAKHAACQACLEACEACIEACEALAA